MSLINHIEDLTRLAMTSGLHVFVRSGFGEITIVVDGQKIVVEEDRFVRMIKDSFPPQPLFSTTDWLWLAANTRKEAELDMYIEKKDDVHFTFGGTIIHITWEEIEDDRINLTPSKIKEGIGDYLKAIEGKEPSAVIDGEQLLSFAKRGYEKGIVVHQGWAVPRVDLIKSLSIFNRPLLKIWVIEPRESVALAFGEYGKNLAILSCYPNIPDGSHIFTNEEYESTSSELVLDWEGIDDGDD